MSANKLINYLPIKDQFAPADKAKVKIVSNAILILFFIEYSLLFRMLCLSASRACYIRFAHYKKKLLLADIDIYIDVYLLSASRVALTTASL